MLDNLEPRDAGHTEPAAQRPQSEHAPLTDREVPLAEHRTSDTIHAWLDGEPVSEEQLRATGKDYAFWQKVQTETQQRRRMQTPTYVTAQIIDAIKKG
jgi:hypothetical protein